MSIRPRRSVLFIPGSNKQAMEQARDLPADCVVFDLEDPVAPDKKSLARDQIDQILKEGGYGDRELLVRINALSTEWGEGDLARFAGADIAGLVVPKISDAQDVLDVEAALTSIAKDSPLKIWTMIETAASIFNIAAIAGASDKMACMVMGISDLAKETRVRHTPGREGFQAAFNLCVYAARVHGLDAIDGVHFQLDDEAALRLSCEQGRNLGFDGKSLIHAPQLETINQAFAPGEAELERSHRIIEAWQAAEKVGEALVIVDGRLVERLHVEEARRILELDAAIRR